MGRVDSDLEANPLFYPRGCAAPLQGIAPIAALERFVVFLPVLADYIGSRPRGWPRGHGESLKLLRAAVTVLRTVNGELTGRLPVICGTYGIWAGGPA